jgi:hypothetical protein
MKPSLLFALFFLIGCNYTKTVTPERYFYVYYQVNDLDGTRNTSGDIWFPCDGFPTKLQIDSIVADGLSKSPECYQPILISYFFEFKSKEDFDAFGKNYKGNLTPHHAKRPCCDLCPLDSILIMDAHSQITSVKPDSLSKLKPKP